VDRRVANLPHHFGQIDGGQQSVNWKDASGKKRSGQNIGNKRFDPALEGIAGCQALVDHTILSLVINRSTCWVAVIFSGLGHLSAIPTIVRFIAPAASDISPNAYS